MSKARRELGAVSSLDSFRKLDLSITISMCGENQIRFLIFFIQLTKFFSNFVLVVKFSIQLTKF